MMDHAITVGEVVKAGLWIGGVVLVIGVAMYVLSIFADAFKH